MQRKIVQGVTSSLSALFIKDQVAFIEQNGYDVKVVCNDDFGKSNVELDVEHIPFEREIDVIKDISALRRLFVYLRRERPDIINFSTPKAGLLGMIAGFLNRTQTRIYVIRGLRLETAGGVKELVLYMTEKIACALSTHVMVISDSLEESVVRMKIVDRVKIVRIGKGSSDGIDLSKFDPGNIHPERLGRLKSDLNIAPGDFVIGYVGRLTRDKGINELISAFKKMSGKYEQLKLLMIGDFEESDPITGDNMKTLNSCDNIIHCSYTDGIEYYYRLMDVFALPTYREGFSNVSIEAQAMGVPVIAFDSTGARDTVNHTKTGLITATNDTEGLIEAMDHLMIEPRILKDMSASSREFVSSHFCREEMHNKLLNFYDSLGKRDDKNVEKDNRILDT